MFHRISRLNHRLVRQKPGPRPYCIDEQLLKLSPHSTSSNFLLSLSQPERHRKPRRLEICMSYIAGMSIWNFGLPRRRRLTLSQRIPEAERAIAGGRMRERKARYVTTLQAQGQKATE